MRSEEKQRKKKNRLRLRLRREFERACERYSDHAALIYFGEKVAKGGGCQDLTPIFSVRICRLSYT
jgi:hypothetical protein